ncbi:acetyltransferase [Nocardioides sp. JQ2195]|uniref:NeuD/PglB/VioB family sugar acetyltransferase n=1 Tax=Nocardioides sp. JQ2195 TaxID=2592334 RepID=UPI00143EE90D|nr:NeuD/PglB/VioB family sugar acetyltransferase [Nocardioides sp. JQ2195]QIX27861.1 acetyltransferase [Nocardioides sp. JQ2195]
MRHLTVVAASGLAGETISAARATGRFVTIEVVDDDPLLRGTRVAGALVRGGLDEIGDHDNRDVVVCAGKGLVRRVLVERLLAHGVSPHRFATIIHPRATVAAEADVGSGCVILAGVVVTANAVIGDHVVVMPQVTLTHDDTVADFATLCAGVALGGSVHVREAAYVGMSACVREGTTVGAGSTLGMGAVLLDDLPDGQTWVGAPARPLVRQGVAV